MKRIKLDSVKKYYCILGFILIFIFIASILVSHGATIKNYFHAYPQDHFQDFFNSMYDTIGRHPYQNGVIYPPLCYAIYLVCLRFIPIEQLGVSSMNLRIYQGPMLSFMFYSLITFLLFIFLFLKLKKGSTKEKYTFLTLFIFSTPFLFEFERANIIFLALILLMIFFVYKDSNNKLMKEISLISLAASAAIKIYPAIFGLILLKEKRYKEIGRVIIYGILLFMLPFLLFGGFQTIVTFYNNLTNTTAMFSENIYMHKLNFNAYFDFLTRIFSLQNTLFPIFGKILYIFLILISCINSLITKSNWKRVLLLTLLMIGIPNISFTYTAIFLLIPIVMFFDDDEKKKKIDYIYLILFALIMFPNPIALFERGDVWHFIKQLSWNSIIMSTSIVIMTIMLNVQIIIENIKENKTKRRDA